MSSAGPGLAGYRGYEYQIVVSVWVALDLVLDRRVCSAVDIEPATQEDIAAKLDVPAESAASKLSAATKQGPISIQIKHDAGMWSAAAFMELIATRIKKGAHGPEPRARALQMLAADSAVRYLLITDAPVDSALGDFVVEEIGAVSRADAGKYASTILEASTANRIAIIRQLVKPLVERHISEQLERVAHVPLARVDACRRALIEAVRARLLGELPSAFSRVEIEQLIAKHGGVKAEGHEAFVLPENFGRLRRRLEEPPHALLLVGVPGIGKTFLAEHLIREHAQDERPFEIVRPQRPNELGGMFAYHGRVLVYLDDPWGKYKLEANALVWSDALPTLLRDFRRSEDKRLLITSRTGLLLEAMPTARSLADVDHALKPLVVELSERDFSAQSRREILVHASARTSRSRRDWIDLHADDVISALTTPMSLVAFAQFAMATPVEQLNVEVIVKASAHHAIGDKVAKRVKELSGIDGAVVLWVFFSTREPLDDNLAGRLTSALLAQNIRVDLPTVLKRLEDDGWISRRSAEISTHPVVIEGLERLVDSVPGSARPALTALFSALAAEESLDVAIRIATQLEKRTLPIPKTVRESIEHYLLATLISGHDESFAAALEALTLLSSSNDPVTLLVRALAPQRPRRGPMSFGFDWKAPGWDDATHARVRGSHEAERVMRRYIRLVLDEWATPSVASAFVRFMYSFGWDLGDDFVYAVKEAFAEASEKVTLQVHGALASPQPAIDVLLQLALDRLDELDDWWERSGLDTQRAAMQGELGADHAAFVLDEAGDRYSSPREVLELVVSAKRQREGYAWVLEHKRRGDALISAWAKSIPDHAAEDHHDEFVALLGARSTDSAHNVFDALGRSECRSMLPHLLQLAREHVGELPHILGAIFGIIDVSEVGTVFGPTLDTMPWPRRASLVFALREVSIPAYSDRVHRSPAAHVDAVVSLVEGAELAGIIACVAVIRRDDDLDLGDLRKIEAPALEKLEQITDEDELLRAAAAVMLATHKRVHAGMDLLGSENERVRQLALHAVVMMTPVPRTAIQPMISDPDYRVRRLAFRALAADAPEDERAALLRCASDKSALVRIACAVAIGDYAWQEGLDTLITLLRDERDRNENSGMADSLPNHHVARAAAWALSRFSAPLPSSVTAALKQFLRRGVKANRDVNVHRELVTVIARERDPALPELFRQLMKSDWRVGRKPGMFAIRYSAFWGWVEHVLSYPEEAANSPINVLIDAAGHTDTRLAAPALVALGICATSFPEGVRGVLQLPETVDDRVLAIEAGMRVAGHQSLANMLEPRLSPTHPGRRLFALWWEPTSEVNDIRTQIASDLELQAWLAELDQPDPIHAAIRNVLQRRPESDAIAKLRSDDYRTDELPEQVQILTAFHFAGAE